MPAVRSVDVKGGAVTGAGDSYGRMKIRPSGPETGSGTVSGTGSGTGDVPAAEIRTDGYAYHELLPMVQTVLAAGLSVLVRGHPGVGKSSLAREVAGGMGLPMVDIRLAQRDPAEIAGVYYPDPGRTCMALLAPDWVRQVCEKPAFVFLDEINAAVTKLHQAAAYQIVLEHRVGPFVFHPETVVMAAGNLEEDGAIVSTLSSALASRFAHFTLRVDADAWVRWAGRAGLDPAMVAYISRGGEEALYDRCSDTAFPSPRTWEMASRASGTARPSDRRRIIAACVGPQAAERLFAFTAIFEAVDPRAVVVDGAPMDFTSPATREPSFVHAAVFTVADWICRQTAVPGPCLPNIVRFLRSPGLDPEFQFLFLRRLKGNDILKRLRGLPEYRVLAAKLAAVHIGLKGDN